MSHSVLQSERFYVPEMDCAEEFRLIRQQLQDKPGVENLAADYLDRVVSVHFNPSTISTDELGSEIRRAGFDNHLAAKNRSMAEVPLLDGWRDTCTASGAAVLILAGLAYWLLPTVSRPLATLAAIVAAAPIAMNAWRAVRAGRMDINLLIVIAGAGAIIIQEYFEAATAVCLFGFSIWLERRSFQRAGRALASLAEWLPDVAHRYRANPAEINGSDTNSQLEDVAPKSLIVGDTILVRPGERIPVDGIVLRGSSSVSEAHLTGESMPVTKSAGIQVYSGSQNGDGSLTLRVAATTEDSTTAQMAKLVEQSRLAQAPIERFVNQFAGWYTPAILLVAAAIGIILPLGIMTFTSSTASEAFIPWAHRGLILLVIACPCALVISTPITLVCGLHRATALGVLIKGAAHLERLAQITACALDKTGTLTTGRMQLVACHGQGKWDDERLLTCAASVELHSTHPIAAAIRRAAHEQGIQTEPVSDVVNEPGLGVQGTWGNHRVMIGSARFLQQHQIDVIATENERNAVHIAVDGASVGWLEFRDELRPDAKEAVQMLRQMLNDNVVMLSGDRSSVAERIANEVGINQFRADLLPADKLRHLDGLGSDHVVAMVGDGMNDAPALAKADVGLAMGRDATEMTLEAADVVVLSPSMVRVPQTLALAQETRRRLWQNIGLALGLKFAILVLTAIGYGSMWLAVLADVGASLIVVANGMRLLRFRLPAPACRHHHSCAADECQGTY